MYSISFHAHQIRLRKKKSNREIEQQKSRLLYI